MAQPRPGQEGLSGDAEEIIKTQTALGNQSWGDVMGKQLEGTSDAKVLQDGAATESFNTAIGGSSPQYVQEALKKRSSKAFDNLGIKMKNEAKFGAAGRVASAQKQAHDALMGKQQIANQAYQRDLMDQQNRRAARNAIIGTIAGGVGAGVGAMAGGPKGAQAGAKAGSSMAGDSTQTTMSGNVA